MAAANPFCEVAVRLNSFPPATQYGQMVTLRIGPELKKFQFHKGLLAHHSLYFKNLSSGRWPSDDKRTIDLPGDNVEAWQCLFSWVYTRTLGQPHRETSDTDERKEIPVRNLVSNQCLMTFVLGDMRMMPGLKNAVIDELFSLWTQGVIIPGPTHIGYIYDNTPAGSAVRKLLIDVLARLDARTDWREKAFKLLGEHVKSIDFWVELACALQRSPERLSGTNWSKINKCDYHDHTDIHASQRAIDKPNQTAIVDDAVVIGGAKEARKAK